MGALYILYQAVDEFDFEKIESTKSSKEIWDILKKAYKEDDRVKQVWFQTLKVKLESMSLEVVDKWLWECGMDNWRIKGPVNTKLKSLLDLLKHTSSSKKKKEVGATLEITPNKSSGWFYFLILFMCNCLAFIFSFSTIMSTITSYYVFNLLLYHRSKSSHS